MNTKLLVVQFMVIATISTTFAEKQILMEFYNATGGAYWYSKSGWGSDAEINTWFGITTNGDGDVVVLSMEQNNLTGIIPSSLGNLKNLEELNLGLNDLTGNIPDSLANLQQLRKLRLDDNLLSGPIPESLIQLSQLKSLDVSHNQLSKLPDAIDQLVTHLTSCNIQYNKIRCPVTSQVAFRCKNDCVL